MLLLHDLLDSPSFTETVAALAAGFRVEHSLPEVRQLGVVVPNVAATVDDLTRSHGIGPFAILTGSPALWLERGESRQVSGRMALGYHEGIELELIEPAQGTEFYGRPPLALPPNSGNLGGERGGWVHHAGLFVPDVDEAAEKLAAPVIVRGALQMGPVLTEFAYMDTLEGAGLILEFITWRIRGRSFIPPPEVMKDPRRLERLLRRS
jgi:hypothetical protein